MLTPALAATTGEEASVRGRAELRPGRFLHSGQRRSEARRRARQPQHLADRFQVHSGPGQGPAVAGPRRDPRPDDRSGTARSWRQLRPTRRSARSLRPATTSASRSAGGGSPSRATSPRSRKRIRRSAAARARSSASATRSRSFTGRVAVGAERGDENALPALRKRRQLFARRRRRPIRCRSGSP